MCSLRSAHHPKRWWAGWTLNKQQVYKDNHTKKNKQMNEIVTQLIASAIDADKIPGLDCFDLSRRNYGEIKIRLNDGSVILITVALES